MMTCILLLGGQSTRVNLDKPKQFLEINGKELFEYSLSTILSTNLFKNIVLAVESNYLEHVKNILEAKYKGKNISLVSGGNTRQKSVYNALSSIKDENVDYVFIHDAARPLASKEIFVSVANEVQNYPAISSFSKISDTICEKNDTDSIKDYLNREKIIKIETPQAFKFDIIFRAHEEYMKLKNFISTDDASLVKHMGVEVALIENKNFNFKVTTSSDIDLLKKILKN